MIALGDYVLVHVVPQADLYPHRNCVSCPCMPQVKRRDRLVVHASWDRREDVEVEEFVLPYVSLEEFREAAS